MIDSDKVTMLNDYDYLQSAPCLLPSMVFNASSVWTLIVDSQNRSNHFLSHHPGLGQPGGDDYTNVSARLTWHSKDAFIRLLEPGSVQSADLERFSGCKLVVKHRKRAPYCQRR